jgi:hypothetical protein
MNTEAVQSSSLYVAVVGRMDWVMEASDFQQCNPNLMSRRKSQYEINR